jgi:outer membrane protein OmpA-like peptidoglycan-associated protein
MKRRILFGLTAATLAVALVGCASMRRNQLADELRTALAGEPVNIVVANDIITLSSSADYLYPSGGWQLRPDASILSKLAPVLATLQNTNIIVAGYTDDTPIGPQLKRMGVTTNTDLSR